MFIRGFNAQKNQYRTSGCADRARQKERNERRLTLLFIVSVSHMAENVTCIARLSLATAHSNGQEQNT